MNRKVIIVALFFWILLRINKVQADKEIQPSQQKFYNSFDEPSLITNLLNFYVTVFLRRRITIVYFKFFIFSLCALKISTTMCLKLET